MNAVRMRMPKATVLLETGNSLQSSFNDKNEGHGYPTTRQFVKPAVTTSQLA
jgi:hypothetical protein